MKKLIILFSLILYGCGERAELLLAADKKSCSGYGYKEGTKDFSNCLMTLDQNRKSLSVQQSQANAMNMQATGVLLGGIASSQPKQPVNCMSSGNMTTCR